MTETIKELLAVIDNFREACSQMQHLKKITDAENLISELRHQIEDSKQLINEKERIIEDMKMQNDEFHLMVENLNLRIASINDEQNMLTAQTNANNDRYIEMLKNEHNDLVFNLRQELENLRNELKHQNQNNEILQTKNQELESKFRIISNGFFNRNDF